MKLIRLFNNKKESLEQCNSSYDTGESYFEQREKCIKSKKSSIVCIVLFLISFGFHLFVVLDSMTLLYQYETMKINEIWSFYLCILSAVVVLITVFTMEKLYVIKIIAIVLYVILFIPVTCLFPLQANIDGKSCTTDINNYGIYDYDFYIEDDYFPESITEDMKPVHYSYFLYDSLDLVYELYLEVKMTDDEYKNYKSKYENELKECFFAPNYVEYSISDKPTFFCLNDEKYEMSSPDVRKIIFNDEEQVIIFVSIVGGDPFECEHSYYYKRFNINPIEYSNYLKENKNESN